MQLGHLRAPDRPSAATRRLASRPQSGVWSDDLANHRRAPPPPTGASTAPSTPTKAMAERATAQLAQWVAPEKAAAGKKTAENAAENTPGRGKATSDEPGPASPAPQTAPHAVQAAQRRVSGSHSQGRRARPSYPPVSPSQRARSLSVSISPPRPVQAQAGALPAQPAQPAQRPPPRAPSPRPKSTSPTPTPTFSILDRPHPSRQRPRSVSPPSSILVTPTESTFVLPQQPPLPALAFPVPRPTPPLSPTYTTFAQSQSQPQTPKKSASTDTTSRTPQKLVKQRPATLHAIQYDCADLADLADLARLSLDSNNNSHGDSNMRPPLLKLAAQGKRPTYGSAAAQFSALVLVKSNTPSIYECAGASASCSSLASRAASIHSASVSSRHMRTQSHGAVRTPATPTTPRTPHTPGTPRTQHAPRTAFPDVPSISVTAPTPSSPRFSFSALFPPKAKSPLSPQKRPPRQRRVSAEASQWAWGAKRHASAQSVSASPQKS